MRSSLDRARHPLQREPHGGSPRRRSRQDHRQIAGTRGAQVSRLSGHAHPASRPSLLGSERVSRRSQVACSGSGNQISMDSDTLGLRQGIFQLSAIAFITVPLGTPARYGRGSGPSRRLKIIGNFDPNSRPQPWQRFRRSPYVADLFASVAGLDTGTPSVWCTASAVG